MSRKRSARSDEHLLSFDQWRRSVSMRLAPVLEGSNDVTLGRKDRLCITPFHVREESTSLDWYRLDEYPLCGDTLFS